MAKAARTKAAESQEETKKALPNTWEKWRVDVKGLGDRKWELTAISLKLDNVRIGEETAELLNSQSHNSNVHYYPKGEVNNGDKKVIIA